MQLIRHVNSGNQTHERWKTNSETLKKNTNSGTLETNSGTMENELWNSGTLETNSGTLEKRTLELWNSTFLFCFVLFAYVLLCLPEALDPTGTAANSASVDADVEKVQVFCFNLVVNPW
jgi:hypothetical protein